jgi:hypothetical protein
MVAPPAPQWSSSGAVHATESSDWMSEMQPIQRSAVVFGARNLGRAVIELLVSDGWAVTGFARSESTLEG